MAKKPKSFNAEIDSLLEGIELPSDKSVEFETSLKKRDTNPEYRKQYLKAQSARKKTKEKKTDWMDGFCKRKIF